MTTNLSKSASPLEPRRDWLETELWNFARACTIDLDHTNTEETMRRSDEIIYNSMHGAFAAYLSAEPRRDEREQFESYSAKHAVNPWWLERDENDEYRSSMVEAEWRAWQAARAYAAPLKQTDKEKS